MGAPVKLLRDPPEAFRLAMTGLHQDIDLICGAAGTSRAQHVVDFVSKSDFGHLANYLDALLSNEAVSSADLKGLINRHDTCVSLRKATDARQFREALRDELRTRSSEAQRK